MQEMQFNPCIRRTWQPTPVFLLGKSHRGAWQAAVHVVSKSWTGLEQLSTSTHDIFIYIYKYEVYIPGSKVCITALRFVIIDCYYLYYDIVY